MTARWLILHLRARRVPAATASVGVITLLASWTGTWLMERPFISDEQARIPVAALGTLAVAGVLATTLGSPDEWLDRSTPTPWLRIRAAHLVIAASLGGLTLATAGLSQPEFFGAPAMARGVVGLLGMAALSAAVIGARASWLAVLVYASTVYLAAPRTPGGTAAVWAWPMQPTRITTSFIAAGVLFTAATAVHAAFGARPTTDAD